MSEQERHFPSPHPGFVTRSEHDLLVHRMENMYGRVLAAFASTVALRDEGVGGHCERVAHNATALARSLQGSFKSPVSASTVYWGGLLHDLGKIVVPEAILNKRGPLVNGEWRIMRAHAEIGANLVEGVSHDFDLIAHAIRSHHEQWDGSGYPSKLAGENIPESARCVAIADVFEAMTTRRPYHEAMSETKGLEHIQELAGSHLWAEGVQRFVELHEQGAIYSCSMLFIPPLEARPTIYPP